jgi:hypothetical protein
VQTAHKKVFHRRICARSRAGWEYVFVAIDDHSRMGHAASHPNEQAIRAVAFLRELVGCHKRFGVKLQRVITDRCRMVSHFTVDKENRFKLLYQTEGHQS